MFLHNLFAICDGDDMIKKSIDFTFDFQQAVKWLVSTAAVESMYHGMVHYMGMVY